MDINSDGQMEIICGWSTGKLQVRKEVNGDVIQEIELEKEISKLIITDLNNSGKKQIACFLVNGEVIGYEYREEDKKLEKPIMAKDAKIPPDDLVKYEKLQKEKQKLLDEIESLTIKFTNRGKSNVSRDENCLPSTTVVKIDLQSNSENVRFLSFNKCSIFSNLKNTIEMC
jgi:Ciliary BBSome complex subunit 2, C-terminal